MHLVVRFKIERDRVDAMACVFRRHVLAAKDVTQVSVAVGADDLDASAVGIGQLFDGAG